MIFLQVPDSADEIAQGTSKTIDSLHSEWTRFLKMAIDSPLDALKFLGENVLGIATKLAIALAIFYVGRWFIRRIKKLMGRIFDRRHVDSSAGIFINNLVSIFLWTLLIVGIIYVFGFSLTGFVAIFAASAFAIGMALSGTMSNFAGGILILIQKPYHVGDYIEAQGYGGTVRTIQLFSTIITTPDNKTIIIPNGPLSTGTINNFSREHNRRVEWKIAISYGDDLDRANKVITCLLDEDQRIIKKLGYTIAINEFTANYANIIVQCWVPSDHFLDVYYDMNKLFYSQLPANNIEFPSNQMDVRITNVADSSEKQQ